MVVQVVKVLPEFDNVEWLEFPSDHQWCVDIEIQGSGEVRESIRISRNDEVEVPSSRGTANLILKLDKSHYASVSIVDIAKVTTSTICSEDADSGKYTAVVAFDCRGCEIKAWRPTGFYTIKTPSGAQFDEVDLQTGEWFDVDTDTNLPVGVLSVKYEIEQYRK